MTWDRANMESLQGKLLVATPELGDPNFAQAVLLLIEHHSEGAMGVVLNRPLRMTVAEAWQQVSEIPCDRQDPLHHGGPCEGPLMVLHEDEDRSDARIGPGLHLTTDVESVASLIDEPTDRIKFVAGYAGWGPGQLEWEIEQGSWLSAAAPSEQILTDQLSWEALVGQLKPAIRPAGLKPELTPDDPTVN